MKTKREIDLTNSLETVYTILKHLTQKEKEQIAGHSSCIFLPKGQMVFREGETPNHLECLISGQVKVFKEGIAGRDWIARMVNSAQLLGYRALFGEENYNVSAQTIQDSIICRIDKDTIFSILKKNSNLMFEIMKILARELGFVHAKTITLTQKHIRGRLAEALLFLEQTYGMEDDSQTLKVKLSREDLANLSNMTTANAIRTLSAFSLEKLVELDGRKIKLLDRHSLEHISQIEAKHIYN
ncbi:MAG: Crp/Fnr family transcriptional regulator [Prevotellaceae bacterium]|jgi:CRP-like cAMP-binding protein|nr:Crp/Fnr family transcriptional regulator [Prevotellaceae bacterium]